MNNYPDKQMARMLESFTPAMWSEVRCVADALDFFAYGMTGQSDWHAMPPLPRSMMEQLVEKLDAMMTRLLTSHERLDLIPQWRAVLEVILPPLPPPSPEPAEDGRRAPRARLCANGPPKKRRKG